MLIINDMLYDIYGVFLANIYLWNIISPVSANNWFLNWLRYKDWPPTVTDVVPEGQMSTGPFRYLDQ